MSKIHYVEQNSEEWEALRRGKFTSSTFGKLFMGKSTKGYNDLINLVVFERITGTSPEPFSNSWTERGHELEPEARQAYELETFNKVHLIGFAEYSEWIGGSPDGLIGNDGTLQIKCPKYSTLIDYMISDKIPKDYYWQIQGELFVSEREWCDFFVYHPNFKPLLKRVARNDKDIQLLKTELDIAIETAQKRITKLKAA